MSLGRVADTRSAAGVYLRDPELGIGIQFYPGPIGLGAHEYPTFGLLTTYWFPSRWEWARLGHYP